MNRKLKLVLTGIFLSLLLTTNYQALYAQGSNSTVYKVEDPETNAKRMQWFKDAKFGIFIHWGIYSVPGIDESWSFYGGSISFKDYIKNLDGFTASNYNPKAWAELFKRAGARYAVLTTKHHDGVALWKGNFDHYNVVDNTPAKRDLIEPYAKALRSQGLKVGLYYSLIDWSHPDFPTFTSDSVRYKKDPLRWKRFTDFYMEQMRELSDRYNPDIYWFDGDWVASAADWRADELRKMMFDKNPNLIVNSRIQGYGDYSTPERGVPISRPANKYWELCMTMNDSWGYQPADNNYKTSFQLLQTLVDCIGNGGNLLLDIGPKGDGSIPDEQIKILEEIGRWTSKHEAAIYGTEAGLLPGHFSGPTAFSKDKKTLYLYIDYQPKSPLVLAGVDGKVKNVRLIGSKNTLKAMRNEKGELIITPPVSGYDPAISVIAVDFYDEPQITKQRLNDEQEFKALMENPRWKEKHGKVSGKSIPGIGNLHYYGLSRLSPDKKTLYLVVNGKPNGPLMIKGVKNTAYLVSVVGGGRKLMQQVLGKLYWSDVPGIIYVTLPKYALDESQTVVALTFSKPIELYEEEGQVIEQN